MMQAQALAIPLLVLQIMSGRTFSIGDAGLFAGTLLLPSSRRICRGEAGPHVLFQDLAADCCYSLGMLPIESSAREWSQHSPQLQDGGWTRSSPSWNKFGKIQCCQMTKRSFGHLARRLTLDSALYSKDSSFSSIELPQTLGSAVPMPGLFLRSFAAPPNMLYINLQLNSWSDPCLLGNDACYWNGWKLLGYEPQTELQGRWFSCKDKRLWRRWRLRQGYLRRRLRRRRGFFRKLGSDLLASVLHKLKYALIAGTAAAELPRSTMECTRSGPKSGVRYRTASTRKFPYMLPILMLLLCLQQADGVKVGVDSTAIPGASAKHCGGTVNMPGSDAQAGPPATVIKKRAYRRALNRALQNGSTRYRGRIMTAAQASWYSPPRLVPQLSESGPHRRTSRSRRIRVLSHNLGGVCTATYDNFCCWLENCNYDVILLQEVHFGLGRSSMQWETPEWNIATSIDPDTRFAGVVICIRKSLASSDQIKVNEVKLGRLLHLRVYPLEQENSHGVSLDVICAYQHATPDKNAAGGARQRFRTSLSRHLASLPRRNLLLLGGDFNCTPTGTAGLTGGGLISPVTAHVDSNDFRDVLVEHDLCAINTWSPRRKRKMHTFQQGERLAQIDFLFLRRHASDHISRESGPLHGLQGLDHSPWRGGSKHAAVSGSIPFFPGWRAGTQRKGPVLGYDKGALDRAVRQNAPEVATLRHTVWARLEQITTYSADALNMALLESCKEVFPPRPGHASLRPWQQEHIQISVRSLWQARSALVELSSNVRSACRGATMGSRLHAVGRPQGERALLSSVFAFLKGHHALHRIYKVLHQQGKKARKQKVIDKLEIAQLAAERHDQMQLYQVIRSLAPKTTRKPVRIKSSSGAPLSSKEEHGEIMQYFSDLFQVDLPCPDPHLDVHAFSGIADALTVTEEELSLALKKNVIGKSVPHNHAPSGAWAACSGLLLGPLCNIANDCLSGRVSVPQRWSDCYLALIPKPNKKLSRPGNLRPLGIQDVAGKSFARVLKNKLLEQVSAKIYQYPQYAYLAGRGTDHAIDRVIQHCTWARDELGHCRRNIHTKRLNHPVQQASGGIQLAVDLSTAFDRVPRWAMRRALQWSGADPHLIRIIEGLHDQCRYHIAHAGFQGMVSMQRGVRQGCTLAPLLFTIFTCFLSDVIGDRTDRQWMLQHLTLYADDTHASWEIRHGSDLRFVEHSIRSIYSVFQEFGMCVNASKSVLVLGLHGSACKTWIQQRLQSTGQGKFMHFGTPLRPLCVPVYNEMCYLGIIASYGSFEVQTMNHRLRIAAGSRQRLIKVLHSSRYLSVRQRLALYAACVRSSSLYGVVAVGFTHKSLELLRKMEQAHVRAICKSPRHLYHERTEDLYRRVGMLEPDHYLIQLLTKQCRFQQQRSGQVDPWKQRSLSFLQDYVQGKTHGVLRMTVDDTVPCPTCGVYFSTVTAMRQHHAKRHKISLAPIARKLSSVRNRVSVTEHCKDGMPVCKHCSRIFGDWTAFKVHISDGCPMLQQSHTGIQAEEMLPALQFAAGQSQEPAGQSAARLPETYSLISCEDVVACLRSSSWQSALQMPGLPARLKNFCGICGQWLSSKPCALRNHVKRMHPHAWQLCPDASHLSSTLSVTRSKPCGACGVMTSKSTVHKCSLMFHLCLLKLLLQVREKPSATLDRYVRGSSEHDSSRGDAASISVCHEAASPGFQHGWDNSHSGRNGGKLEQGGEASKMAQGEFQRRLKEGQRKYWSKVRPRAQAPGVGLQVGGRGSHRQSLEPRSGQPQGLDSASGQDLPSPRGRTSPEPSGEGVCADIRGAWRRDPSLDVGFCTGMEEGSGGEESLLQPAAHTFSGFSSGMDAAPGPHGPEGGTGRRDQVGRGTAESPKPGVGMAVSALEPGSKEDGEYAWSRPCASRGHDGMAGRNHPGHGGDTVAFEVPLDASTGGDVSGGNCHLLADFGVSRPTHGPHVHPPGTDARLRQHESCGIQDASGQSRKTALGEDPGGALSSSNAPEIDLRSLSCPKLRNPHNICYINSFLLLMIWMHRTTGHRTGDSFGRLRQAFEALQRMTSACVLDLFHWHPCLSQWPNISSQQDVAEFALFVLSWSQPAAYLVSWSAKRIGADDDAGRTVVTDSGCGFSPLIMDICRGGLQDCFDSWQSQSSMHGLRRETDFLLVQLRRYAQRGGRVFKTGSPISILPGESVWVPCWDEGTDMRYVEYHARALIFHLGANLLTGHYRAALSFGARTGLPHWYLTDDGIHPAMATSEDLQMLAKNVYIVGLVRAEL